eukprot:200673-Pelagomonas_calceolata.AAC.1
MGAIPGLLVCLRLEVYRYRQLCIRGYKAYKGVGLQPETLADRLLVKHPHPASKIETNSNKKI